MAEINKFNFNNNAVTCIIVKRQPVVRSRRSCDHSWIRKHKQAIINNVDDDKQTYEQLLDMMQVKGSRPFEANEKTLYLSTNQVSIV